MPLVADEDDSPSSRGRRARACSPVGSRRHSRTLRSIDHRPWQRSLVRLGWPPGGCRRPAAPAAADGGELQPDRRGRAALRAAARRASMREAVTCASCRRGGPAMQRGGASQRRRVEDGGDRVGSGSHPQRAHPGTGGRASTSIETHRRQRAPSRRGCSWRCGPTGWRRRGRRQQATRPDVALAPSIVRTSVRSMPARG